MRRRHLLTFFSSLSLLLCAAVCLLWSRARAPVAPGFVSWRLTKDTFVAARCDPAGITIVLPPRPGPPAGEAAVRTLTEVMSNRDIEFLCSARGDGLQFEACNVLSLPRDGTTAARTWDFTSTSPLPELALSVMYGNARPAGGLDAYRRPLLEALDDPNRFVVAHDLLSAGLARFSAQRLPGGKVPLIRRGDGYAVDHYGLEVELPRPPPPPGVQTVRERVERGRIGGEGMGFCSYRFDRVDARPHINLAQLPAIRRGWTIWLGRPVVTIPYWSLAGACLLAPAAWVISVGRRVAAVRRARRAGLCRKCGYDLRATPDRCPECGAVPAPR